MRHQRWGTLAGILAAVVIVLVSVQLVLAQEGQPPSVQPADVDAQVSTLLWDQLDSVANGEPTVPSYVKSSDWSRAADDFFVTGTVEAHTAWIVSKVTVRAFVDWPSSPGSERASICFYPDAGGLPMSSALACYSGLSAEWAREGDDQLYLYRVLTYTLPSSPLLFTTSPRYWVSVQMTGLAVNGAWYWRSRSVGADNPHAGSLPFAFQHSSGFYSGNYGPGCLQWQVQTLSNNCAIGDTGWWPDGQDLSFRLWGSYFDGTLLPQVYTPFIRR